MNRETERALRYEFEREFTPRDRKSLETDLRLLSDLARQFRLDLGDLPTVHQLLHEVIQEHEQRLEDERAAAEADRRYRSRRHRVYADHE